MKILFLTNNNISDPLIQWLEEDKNNDIKVLSDKLTLKTLQEVNPWITISYNYKYIIPTEIVECSNKRIINLHISYLPWNKGSHPNIWSIITNTPSGVSIHQVDSDIDTGPVLLQKQVLIDEPSETIKSSYKKLHNEIQELFKDNWEQLKNFKIRPSKQNLKGSMHYVKD